MTRTLQKTIKNIVHSPTLMGRVGMGLFVLLLVACANIGSPDGGPYDETPPRIVRTSPKFGSVNTKTTKVVIEFDEIVKVENAQEKIVISPPQLEQPEVEANGRKITVSLMDTLRPNSTYTIDFADAILDNNEGNPFGDYAFTFSTGESIDTMQVSGTVLNAEDLEPIKGMLVGLYKTGDARSDSTDMELPDSIFRTRPLERISRTDSRGHFTIKGLANGRYRVFALGDQNQNFLYDQRSELLAFTDRIISTSCAHEVRTDTVWHDSIHYESIVSVPFTHFYPDDIVLLAFQTAKQDRHMLKSERLTPRMFSLYFTAPDDSLPRLTGLNFDADSAFVIDASEHNDTINYWIRDSLVYNIDTLDIKVDYYATDSTGTLALTTDTLNLVSKLTRERIAKQEQEKQERWAKDYRQKYRNEMRMKERQAQADSVATRLNAQAALPDSLALPDSTALVDSTALADSLTVPAVTDSPPTATDSASAKPAKKKTKRKKIKDEDIEVPPMPEEFMKYKTSNTTSLSPDRNVQFDFPEPLDSIDMSKLHFSVKVDTLFYPAKFLFRQVPGQIKSYRLYAEWQPDSTYQLVVDTAAFVSIYGQRTAGVTTNIKVKNLDDCTTLFVTLRDAGENPYVQLLDNSDKVVKTIKADGDGKADFYFLNPGTYYMRMFNDLNDNGLWDTGEYDEQLQPEPVYYYPKPMLLKAKWEISQEWQPRATALTKQKPEKITKQKPDKERRNNRNRNQERLQQKRNSK